MAASARPAGSQTRQSPEFNLAELEALRQLKRALIHQLNAARALKVLTSPASQRAALVRFEEAEKRALAAFADIESVLLASEVA